jgi:hypothetical protein
MCVGGSDIDGILMRLPLLIRRELVVIKEGPKLLCEIFELP